MAADQLQMEAEIALVGYVDWNMAWDCDTQVALQVFDGGVVEFVGKRQFDEQGSLFEREVEPLADVPCQVAQLRRPQRAVRIGAQRQAGVRPAAGICSMLVRRVSRAFCDRKGAVATVTYSRMASMSSAWRRASCCFISSSNWLYLPCRIAVRPGGDSRFDLVASLTGLIPIVSARVSACSVTAARVRSVCQPPTFADWRKERASIL